MFFAPASEKIGSIKAWAGAAVPAGWLDCNGAAVSRSTYAALFAEIGTAYGAGDGSTTFNLPDFRGRSIVGAGTGSGLTARARGGSGGAESVALAESEMPAHTHNLGRQHQITPAGGGPSIGDLDDQTSARATQSKGGSAAHNNMPPFGVAFFIIKAEG